MFSIARGTCHVIFVYDIAFAIYLNEAERWISSATRETLKHKKRCALQYFEYYPPPLRIAQGAERVVIDTTFATDLQVELVVYDFGAVIVIYRIDLSCDGSRLLSLSEELYENKQLLADFRQRVEDLLKVIEPALTKANISSFVEDYVIFQVGAFAEQICVEDLTTRYAAQVAQNIRAEYSASSADDTHDDTTKRT